MDRSLLRPHDVTLAREGIPYRLARHLTRGGMAHDANLQQGSGRDDDCQEVQRLERAVGTLSDELLDRRVAADCCCIWRYDYPDNVARIAAIVGGSPHTALRLHFQVCPLRRRDVSAYGDAMRGWLADAAPDDPAVFQPEIQPIVQRVYGYLGARERVKDLLVERTCLGLAARALNCSFWGRNELESVTPLQPFSSEPLTPQRIERLHELERTIRSEMGSQAADFLCDVGGAAEPACHFKFTRRIDILISSIGCLRWRGAVPPKDAAVRGRRRLTRVYLNALEGYWREGRTDAAAGDAAAISDQLTEALGTPTDAKRWLVACLWKNIWNQTEYHGFPMQRWIEFVRTGESWLDDLSS